MKVTTHTLEARAMMAKEPDKNATVVERIKYLIVKSHKTQADFGRLINVDPTNMSKMLNGHSPVTDGILNRIVVNLGVSKQWLKYGTDVPYAKHRNMPNVIPDGEHVAQSCIGAPVYEIDVTAGSRELSSMFTDERIVGRLSMPGIDSDHPIVRVSGDSMYPRITNNSFIQIREISDPSTIFWGSIYVVVLEDYRMVKQIRRHPDPSKVILHSLNPEYDDMEIERCQLISLFLVETILNYDIIA